MRSLLLWPQAQRDVADAVGWYEGQRASLSSSFLEEVDRALRRIRRHPFQFPQLHQEVRRALLRRFPYSVYFMVSDASIEVIAVLHQHRRTETWSRRQGNPSQ